MAQARYQRQAAPEIPRFRGLGDDGDLEVADQLNRFRDQVGRSVDPMIADEQANTVRQTVAAGGDVNPSIGLTPIQQARNAVAQQAYGDRISVSLATKASELSQRFDGKVPDGSNIQDYIASYEKELDSFAAPQLAGVPEAFRGQAAQHWNTLRAREVTQLQEKAFAHEDKLFADNILAADKLDGDLLFKAMRDGDEQAANEAGQRMAGRRQQMLDAGLMGIEEAKASEMQIRQAALGEKLYGQVLRGGGPSLEEVQAGKGEAAGLSLEARDHLARQIQTEMEHQRSEQAAARAAQKAFVKGTSANARRLADTIEANIPLTPAQEQAAAGLLQRPDILTPAAHRDLAEAYNVRRITSQATTGTVAEATAFLGTLNAQHPTTLEQAKVKEKSVKQIEAFISDVNGDDPLGKLSARGAIPNGLAPIDYSSPETLGASLVARIPQTQIVSMQFGREMPTMTADESRLLARTMDGWSNEQQAVALAGINQTGPESAAAIREGLSKGGAPTLAQAGLAAEYGDTDTATAQLRGREKIKAGVAKGLTENERIEAVATAGIGMLPVATQNELLAGAEAYAAETGVSIDDALGRVGGATHPYRGGKPLILPFGVTDGGAFSDRVESVSDAEALAMGGTPEQAAAIRNGKAKLESIGGGRYLVAIGQTVLPWQLDYSKISAKSSLQRPIVRDVLGAGRAIGEGVDVAGELVRQDPTVRTLAEGASMLAGGAADAGAIALDVVGKLPGVRYPQQAADALKKYVSVPEGGN